MKDKILKISAIAALTGLCSLSNCDPNNHKASDHPCHFPDAFTEANLRQGWTYKIIDKKTSQNLVGVTKTATIHADSVVLMDENLDVIQRSYRYYIDNWIFDNLFFYKDVPFNDPDALLNLKERTFYLRTSYKDIDTIKILFKQCLINPPILFNGISANRPDNDPYSAGIAFYFKK